jgi:hypothetical protein
MAGRLPEEVVRREELVAEGSEAAAGREREGSATDEFAPFRRSRSYGRLTDARDERVRAAIDDGNQI